LRCGPGSDKIGPDKGVAMVGIISRPNTQQKLEILSAESRYDLACACSTHRDEHRRRGADGRWIYPVALPNGRKATLFKTLLSNVCTHDCKYCPLRAQRGLLRCTLGLEETARVFLDYYRQKKVFGLFLSSGVVKSPDATMQRLNDVAGILRKKYAFKGYIHLKVIPGASDAAIEQAVSLADAVSLNIETPGPEYLARLSSGKDYLRDIVGPMKLISALTAPGSRYHGVKHTTQFVVGAAGESDARIVKYTFALYKRLGLNRVYFSAYQKGLGDGSIPGENAADTGPTDPLTREHRLYQVDFLLRKYGFKEQDIVFEQDGNLSLTTDPKEAWALANPHRFPVDVNRASKWDLLRVPGLGPITVSRILAHRRDRRLRSIEDIPGAGALLRKAEKYLAF